MQIFLAACSKQQPWTVSSCEIITNRIYKHYLDIGFYLNLFQWRSPQNNLAFWLFYNELFPSIQSRNLIWNVKSLIYVSGYTHQPLATLLNHSYSDQNLDLQSSRDRLDRASGLFSSLILDGDNAVGWAQPAYSRVEGLFWTETPNHVWVSNRPIPPHLAARKIMGQTTPDYDHEHLWGFINSGFFWDDGTPYKNTHNITNNQCLEITPTGAKLSAIGNVSTFQTDSKSYLNQYLKDYHFHDDNDNFSDHSVHRSYTQESQLYDEITDAFLASFLPLQQSNKPIAFTLTGGKDSRLVAAALKYLGLENQVTAFTLGLPDHGDVMLAQQIAQTLGLKYIPPTLPLGLSSTNPVILLDAWHNAVCNIGVSDGLSNVAVRGPFSLRDPQNFLTEGYSVSPHLSSDLYHFQDQFMMVTGHGGELIRGGYGKLDQNHKSTTSREIVKQKHHFFKGLSHRYKDFGQSDLVDQWTARFYERTDTLNQLLKSAATLSDLPWRSYLNDVYRNHRAGRWSHASRLWQGSNTQIIQPFFEANFLKSLTRIPLRSQLNEQLIYELLKRLAPQLLEIPYFRSSLYAPQYTNQPPPLMSTHARMEFRIMEVFSSAMQEQWREYCWGNFAPAALIEMLNVEQLENLIASGRIVQQPRQHWQLFWNLFTVSCLLSDQWRSPTSQSCIMEIPLPPL